MKKNGAAEPFIMLPRSLLESAAWQAASINVHRLLWFLMIEHMTHGGRQNGFLVAPRKQLADFGIGAHFISAAIAEACSLGLVDCVRGKGRAPSRYALTWLRLSDGTAPGNRWQHCAEQAAETISLRKHAKTRIASAKQHSQQASSLRCQ